LYQIKQNMKKAITLPLLLIAFFLLSSSTNKNSIIKSIIGVKWRVDDPAVTTTVCFKKDGTFWHYYANSIADSLMFCRWSVENDKLYLFDDGNVDLKFFYVEIISSEKNSMTIKDTRKNKYIKFLKK